ncbi:hypothetical protein HMPREF1567_0154 [Providencia alcalifaciens PAL-2]|nr:hypothetical protein [Providencia alcalifaciens]ETT07781.1 hypothetical protein HMPREF1562_2533 [Providencia alcalifaciens F90-2004]EUC97178.1 hypothetical protein HMPREF1567_0154 [Providencia alcalifaciens PAL-2]
MCLAVAMIAYADYNPESDALFDVMCSVEKLAELCGQLHRYASGRKSYDPIMRCEIGIWPILLLLTAILM